MMNSDDARRLAAVYATRIQKVATDRSEATNIRWTELAAVLRTLAEPAPITADHLAAALESVLRSDTEAARARALLRVYKGLQDLEKPV